MHLQQTQQPHSTSSLSRTVRLEHPAAYNSAGRHARRNAFFDGSEACLPSHWRYDQCQTTVEFALEVDILGFDVDSIDRGCVVYYESRGIFLGAVHALPQIREYSIMLPFCSNTSLWTRKRRDGIFNGSPFATTRWLSRKWLQVDLNDMVAVKRAFFPRSGVWGKLKQWKKFLKD